MNCKPKFFLLAGACFFALLLHAQNPEVERLDMCKNLNKVFESGRKENFESLKAPVQQSPFLPVPGYSVRLNRFPVCYVDKDHRFVAKTNMNFDSLTVINKLVEYRDYVATCLDSTKLSWTETQGDDSTTAFFKELKELNSPYVLFNISFAAIQVGTKVYSVAMYIRRK